LPQMKEIDKVHEIVIQDRAKFILKASESERYLGRFN